MTFSKKVTIQTNICIILNFSQARLLNKCLIYIVMHREFFKKSIKSLRVMINTRQLEKHYKKSANYTLGVLGSNAMYKDLMKNPNFINTRTLLLLHLLAMLPAVLIASPQRGLALEKAAAHDSVTAAALLTAWLPGLCCYLPLARQLAALCGLLVCLLGICSLICKLPAAGLSASWLPACNYPALGLLLGCCLYVKLYRKKNG